MVKLEDNTLTALAVISQNYNRNKDFIESFLPLVSHCIFKQKRDEISLVELSDTIKKEFCINLPQTVLQQLLRRLSRKKIITAKNKVYFRNETEKNSKEITSFSNLIAKSDRKYLIQQGYLFARERFKLEEGDFNFDESLLAFLKSEFGVTKKLLLSNDLPVDEHSNPPKKKDNSKSTLAARNLLVIGEFIREKYQYDDRITNQLTLLARGVVLLNALPSYRERESFDKPKFTLHIFLDTSLILRLLGACGPEREEYVSEILDFAEKLNIKVEVFEHNIREAENILYSCEYQISHPNNLYSGEAIEYMISEGWDTPRVARIRNSMEAELNRLNIGIIKKPKIKPEFSIGEDQAKTVLQNHVSYRHDSSKDVDYDSIQAVYSIRECKNFSKIEECRALLVTSNNRLSRASAELDRQIFQESVSPQSRYGSQGNFIPPVILDHQIASYLWSINGFSHEDYPSKLVSIAALSATEPDQEVWESIVKYIDELRDDKKISPTDHMLLRQDRTARSILVAARLEDDDVLSEGRLKNVLKYAQGRLAIEAQEKMEKAQQEADAIREERDTILKESRVEKLNSESEKSKIIEQSSKEVIKVKENSLQSSVAIAHNYSLKRSLILSRIVLFLLVAILSIPAILLFINFESKILSLLYITVSVLIGVKGYNQDKIRRCIAARSYKKSYVKFVNHKIADELEIEVSSLNQAEIFLKIYPGVKTEMGYSPNSINSL